MNLTKMQAACVARHLQSYLLLMDGKSEFMLPCGYCEYSGEPGRTKCSHSFRAETFSYVGKETGVELHWWKGLMPTPPLPVEPVGTGPDAGIVNLANSQQGLL